ncbi:MULTISPECIES: multicopper oxidase domain-containing protein [unclassified Nocardioides]|uniref:multicopper oxidase domain-containing protein n=1 Tax=unclassified Nocardioides TaxID=2615069 RepID=UPI0000EB6208|nr:MULTISPECIES: multicopper oxidase domain-containing protein [unclassified Nocardioides]ABL81610.1 multicopper oxidase, type 3 [Nocardioides sp. JS614]
MTVIGTRSRPVGSGARRGFSPLRDLPALLWLIAVVVVSLAHRELPAPRWLLIHLLLLGAVTHSILVWSQHFTDALLHNAPTAAAYRTRSVRLLLSNAGAALVLVAVPTDRWVLATVGASAVALAVGWHSVSLVGQLRHGLGSRFAVTVRYYVASAALLPLGALFGVLMARGLSEHWHERIMLAHVMVNVLGWMGLTVLGTVVTLWPTMLRTRIAEGAEQTARRALPLLLAGLLIGVAGCLLDLRPVAGAGLLVYAGALALLARPFVSVARAKPPRHFATWSVAAAVAWLAGLVTVLGVGVLVASSWMDAHELAGAITPGLAAGFGAQVLLGAMSYLVPVVVGGGPSGARAANVEMDRGGALRVAITNVGLVVFLLPAPSPVRVVVSAVVLVALAAFLPLMIRALRAARRARRLPVESVPKGERTGPAPVAADRPRGQVTGLAATGVALVVLAVAVGVAVDPTALAGTRHESSAAGIAASGETTTVEVTAKDMRFTPDTVQVPAGNRLVIELKNTDDTDVHDLVLDTGIDSGRLAPGESLVLDVGVVGRDIEGWCSVVGHRQMGMVFHVEVTGLDQARAAAPDGTASGTDQMAGMPGMDHGHGTAQAGAAPPGTTATGAAADLDFAATPGAGFEAHEPTLPPLEGSQVHRRTFRVSEMTAEVAPGVRQQLWTYNGTMPGPTLHGRVGDRFVIRLVNDTQQGHSIDFHAGETAPDQNMRTIAPGESLVYEFTARRSGIWLYHCSTMPMAVHIANGMFGAVVIDPPNLPRVDKSYLMVQSELYLGDQDGPVDAAKVMGERPDAVVFNGYANQYDHDQIEVKVGERVRVWVLDAGPNRTTSFHVVGEQFDTVFAEGAYLLRPGNAEQGGSQALALGPAQGGFVELSFDEPGHYPFVSHLMVDAERGAHGIFHVTR